MKKTFAAILIICLAGAGYLYIKNQNPVTHQEFTDYKKEFRAEIDSIKRNQKRMELNQDTMKADLDTVKTGQQVIYEHVSKQAGKEETSFIQDLFKLM